ncbi:MAG: tetratricopeptide repeat protein [Thermoguttaceae bacterium]|nr:tetratricopeptide repeat protein [Thermoguttaceae bacterium]
MKRYPSRSPLLLLVLLLALVGCTREKAARRESLRQTATGDAAMRENAWNDAVRHYTSALEADPRNTDALYGRSGAHLVIGKDSYLLARAAAAEGEMTRAREFADKADRDFSLAAQDAAAVLKINPDAADACYVLGCVAVYQGDWFGAIDAFTETIKRAPEMACAYQRRGEVYGYINDLENESTDLKQAARLGYTSLDEPEAPEDEFSRTAGTETKDSLY